MELNPKTFNNTCRVRHLDLNKLLKEYFSDDEKLKKTLKKVNKKKL